MVKLLLFSIKGIYNWNLTLIPHINWNSHIKFKLPLNPYWTSPTPAPLASFNPSCGIFLGETAMLVLQIYPQDTIGLSSLKKWVVLVILLITVNSVIYMANGTITWHFFNDMTFF